MKPWTYFPTSTLPAKLDIVWCQFPSHLDLGAPGPKPRPALVLHTAISEPGFCPEVHVMYGTSVLKSRERPRDFFVQNYHEMHEAGLFQATRFDLERILWLPWAQEFFVPPSPKYPSPVIGHLSENSTKLLGYILMEYQRRKSGQTPDEE